MPRFNLRNHSDPGDVCVTISRSGATASITPPARYRPDIDIRDMRLSTALHVAAALALRLGTDVTIVDEDDAVFFIEDDLSDLTFVDAGSADLLSFKRAS